MHFEMPTLVPIFIQNMQYPQKGIRQYLSLVLLFVPALAFIALLVWYREAPELALQPHFPFAPWQFWAMGVFGTLATIGGVLDWCYHRDPLRLQLAAKERDAEALALGTGGAPMFVLMWLATMSARPAIYLLPIVVVLIYTVTLICYDEFVFHRNRCGPRETLYHRLLVFGNGLAWLAWFHFVF